jgi:hypothetical protein
MPNRAQIPGYVQSSEDEKKTGGSKSRSFNTWFGGYEIMMLGNPVKDKNTTNSIETTQSIAILSFSSAFGHCRYWYQKPTAQMYSLQMY